MVTWSCLAFSFLPILAMLLLALFPSSCLLRPSSKATFCSQLPSSPQTCKTFHTALLHSQREGFQKAPRGRVQEGWRGPGEPRSGKARVSPRLLQKAADPSPPPFFLLLPYSFQGKGRAWDGVERLAWRDLTKPDWGSWVKLG